MDKNNNNYKGKKMKILNKNIIAAAMALTCVSSFAQSSSAGIDPTGEGVIHITGTAVGSCTAPTLNIDMGSIDMHTSINGTLGTYEKALVLPVTCSNPNQNWTILPAVRAFNIEGGVIGGNIAFQNGQPYDVITENYVAIVATTSVAGTVMSMSDAMSGVGSQSVNAKAIFGKNIPVDTSGFSSGESLVGDPVAWFTAQNLGIPMGTIDNRGTFSVDVPLIIMY